jgi:hypothetical protein
MREHHPRLFAEIVETTRTRDVVIEGTDGGSASYRTRPPGDGWRIAIDHERATTWSRRKPIAWRPVRRRNGGWRA